MKVSIKSRRDGSIFVVPPRWWALKRGVIKNVKQEVPVSHCLLLKGVERELFLSLLPDGVVKALKDNWMVCHDIERKEYEICLG